MGLHASLLSPFPPVPKALPILPWSPLRSAPGDTGLVRVFNESITHLKRAEQETRTAKIYEERFVWPILAALALLLGEALLSDRRKQPQPHAEVSA